MSGSRLAIFILVAAVVGAFAVGLAGRYLVLAHRARLAAPHASPR